MSAILHILKKDMRHFRWAWIALILFSILEVILYGTHAGFSDSKFISFLEFCSVTGRAVLAFVLTALVVQQESIVDPDSYWLTRPISRVHLLLSKVLFCFSFIVVPPVLSQCLILLLNDGAFRLNYGLTSFLSPMVWSLSFVFLAANTRSFPRFLLLLAILLISIYGLVLALAFSGVPMNFGVLPAETPSHIATLIQMLIWHCGIGLSLFLLYTTRHLLKSWVPLALFLILSMICMPGGSFSAFFLHRIE